MGLHICREMGAFPHNSHTAWNCADGCGRLSAGPGNQYQALLHLSTGSSKGVQGYQDRLGQGRSYAVKETDH